MNAVIYCRVSSQNQVNEGHGLDGQERRCMDYARTNNYTVLKVFRDEGESGGIFDRPALQEMFAFMQKNPSVDMVLFEDISRIARDVGVHIQIISEIARLGAKYQTVNQPIEDSAVGKFISNSLANVAELHRNLNKQNVISKMKARLQAGYWCFDHPPGYKSGKSPEHGKLLVRDEPKASMIAEALEGFASKRFLTQLDVAHFLHSKGFFHRTKSDQVYLDQVKRILTRILYAGYIEYPKWGIMLTKAQHEPLISMATYQRIQQRLAEGTRTPAKSGIEEDFPLRGFVVCGCCNKTMTASWSKGRNGKVAYYRCNPKECALYGKSIRKDLMEKQFEEKLKTIKPKEKILSFVKAALMDVWDNRSNDMQNLVEVHQKKEQDIESRIKNYTKRIGETGSSSVIEEYEKQIEELKTEKLRLGGSIEMDTSKIAKYDFGTVLRIVFDFIKNPYEMWNTGNLQVKRLVLRLVFSEPLVYTKGIGFGTMSLSLPVEVSCVSVSSKEEMVEMPGIEPGSNV